MWVNLYGLDIYNKVRVPTSLIHVMDHLCVGCCAREISPLQVPSNQDIVNVAAGVLNLAEQVLQVEWDGANDYL